VIEDHISIVLLGLLNLGEGSQGPGHFFQLVPASMLPVTVPPAAFVAVLPLAVQHDACILDIQYML